MLKKYNVSAELLVLASAYFNKGQKKDAAKLALLAFAEDDSVELFDDLDNANQELDPTSQEAPAEEEIISDADLEEVVEEIETPAEETIEEEVEEIEAEGEEIEDETCEDCAEEELPSVEEVVSKVQSRKEILANLASLSGKTEARREAIKKFLSK